MRALALAAAVVLFSFNVNIAQADGDGCGEPAAPIKADDSSQKVYFEELLQRSTTAPISDFVHLWYPERDQPGGKTYFLDQPCLDQPGGSLVQDASGFVIDGCQPDTLYSWGGQQKFNGIRNTYADGQEWHGEAIPKHGSLWATISPVSTYSYGPIPLRLRLKPGVKFRNTVETAPDQVDYPAKGAGLQDFILHDFNLVESYSFGTPEHYDEIVKDIRRIESGQPVMVYWSILLSGSGIDRVYHAGVPERGPQDEATLRANLTGMIRMILGGEGRIFYSKAACRNQVKHFSTTRPTYFNP